MGGCCSWCLGERNRDQVVQTKSKKKKFGGTGQRLGSVVEDAYGSGATPASMRPKADEDPLPEPIVDPNLDDAARAQIRAERAAAAEARLKRLTGNGKKKLPNPDAQPLRGPNNQPLMTWSVGN